MTFAHPVDVRAETTQELEKEQQNTTKNHSSRTRWSFGRILKGFLILDAALVLYLTAGFILPGQPVRDTQTGGLPEQGYDYSAKISPLTQPAPEPRDHAAEIVTITARGPNPTFVPPASDPDMDAAGVDATRMLDATGGYDSMVVPASQAGTHTQNVVPAVTRTPPPQPRPALYSASVETVSAHSLD